MAAVNSGRALGVLLPAFALLMVLATVFAPRTTPRGVPVTPSGVPSRGEGATAPSSDRALLEASSFDRDSASPPPTVSPPPSGAPSAKLGDATCDRPCATLRFGVRGTATWYCRPPISRCTVGYPGGWYAAAGPALRAWLGSEWRGLHVIVTDAAGNRVRVQLVDWCLCGGDHVIDLYWDAFAGLVNPVTVTVE